MESESIGEMRGWIPPIPLALGALVGALSWLLVIAYGRTPSFGIELAWIHAVALGSFTSIALAVLIHVIPGFTDLSWRARTVARASGAALPFTAVAFVLSFATGSQVGVAMFGILSALLLLGFASSAIATLTQAAPTPAERAIARAFVIVFVFLAIAALLGVALAIGLRSGDANLLRFAPEHGAIAIVGWLTLLTMGVSARTFRPILGSEPRWRVIHILSNSAMVLAAVAIPLTIASGNSQLVKVAFLVSVVAAAAYGADGFDRLLRARTPNRPAHAFVAASLLWLLCATIAAASGAYEVAVVIALAAWLGQMINAHLHHIGIRVIATTFGGDDNEMRPWLLLDARLSWVTFSLAQIAVVLLVFAVATDRSQLFLFSGSAGLAAAAAFATNAAMAIARVRRAPQPEYTNR